MRFHLFALLLGVAFIAAVTSTEEVDKEAENQLEELSNLDEKSVEENVEDLPLDGDSVVESDDEERSFDETDEEKKEEEEEEDDEARSVEDDDVGEADETEEEEEEENDEERSVDESEVDEESKRFLFKRCRTRTYFAKYYKGYRFMRKIWNRYIPTTVKNTACLQPNAVCFPPFGGRCKTIYAYFYTYGKRGNGPVIRIRARKAIGCKCTKPIITKPCRTRTYYTSSYNGYRFMRKLFNKWIPTTVRNTACLQPNALCNPPTGGRCKTIYIYFYTYGRRGSGPVIRIRARRANGCRCTPSISGRCLTRSVYRTSYNGLRFTKKVGNRWVFYSVKNTPCLRPGASCSPPTGGRCKTIYSYFYTYGRCGNAAPVYFKAKKQICRCSR